MSNDALSNCGFVQLNYLQSQEVRNTKDKWTIILCSPSFPFLSSPSLSSRLVSSFSLPCSATVTNAFAREIKMAACKKNLNNHVQISFTGRPEKNLIHSNSKISNSYKNIFPPNTLQMWVSSQLHLWNSLIILFVVQQCMFLLGMLIFPIADKHRNSTVVQTAYLWSAWGVSFLFWYLHRKEVIL